MLDLYLPKITAYLIERVVLFLTLTLFRYTLFRKHQFLKELSFFLLAWYVSCACELFSFNLFVFVINSFHTQLYVKEQFLNVLEVKKKKTIQFPLSFNLYFQQKKPQSCQFVTYRRNALFELLTSQTGQSYHQVVMYLFNSLAKSCTIFWKYS